MPHHYLHDDVLEEHKRNIKLSMNRGRAVCARCGDLLEGKEHYEGTDASSMVSDYTLGSRGNAEGSGEQIKICKHCYGKETGINIGQYRETYSPTGQTRHKKGF